MQWAGAVVAIHPTFVAPTVVGVAEFKECLAELHQFLHPFIPSGEQAFASFVAINDGAGPAAEARAAATRSAGINLNGALAACGVCVEFVKGPVVATPGVGVLKQVSPDFLGDEELNRIGYPHARQVGVPVET